MKTQLTNEICSIMINHLSPEQNRLLKSALHQVFTNFSLPDHASLFPEDAYQQDVKLINLFIAAKRIEGCSENTLKYYSNTLTKMVESLQKNVCNIDTNDLRYYLSNYQANRDPSKVTLDNIRRIMSSFFAWLEDEALELLRDQCTNPRDLAMIDLLISTGIRVGELVKLDRKDINFDERECIVLGKGDKERPVYFDAKTKIHLQHYLETRTDNNPALFVTLNSPWNRLSIAGVEYSLKKLGSQSQINHVHPHKFRRTMATMAIEKGMPIEQVQCLLGHTKIDTTLHYANVNQSNVKISHRRYLG